MKHVGIITEYNPFHNGHSYQLQKVKQLFPEKSIVIIMSGDFVQRGEPAMYNKYLRTECALANGADIIFELPSYLSAQSAEHFASSAILGLAKTGVIDTLCFGAESDNLEAMKQIAKLLIHEPSEYQSLLKKYLNTGLSYPKSRALAIGTYFKNADYEALLCSPNNILGIEYIKAIYRYHLDITPVIIKRQGKDYHDTTLNHPLSSATALRETVKQNKAASNECLKDFMPEKAFHLLSTSELAKPLFLADFYTFLQYSLWKNRSSYNDFFEMSKELSNRLSYYNLYPSNIEELITQLSGKNYTKTRICRALLNLLFGLTNENMAAIRRNEYLSYLRILGFSTESSSILKEMKQQSALPIVNKMADAHKTLSESAYTYFQMNIQISNLYKQVFFNKYGIPMPSEYEQSVIIPK